MIKIQVTDRDGLEHEIEGREGDHLMETLREFDWGVAAICGGMCSCGTCHVFIEGDWPAKFPAQDVDEEDLIEMLEYGHFNPATTFLLVSKEVKAQMRIRAKDKANLNFSIANGLSGEEIVVFGGEAQVLRCDSISTSESVVV